MVTPFRVFFATFAADASGPEDGRDQLSDSGTLELPASDTRRTSMNHPDGNGVVKYSVSSDNLLVVS